MQHRSDQNFGRILHKTRVLQDAGKNSLPMTKSMPATKPTVSVRHPHPKCRHGSDGAKRGSDFQSLVERGVDVEIKTFRINPANMQVENVAHGADGNAMRLC